mmetsp:Transcript_29764/g.74841  ORF Transcript_29764/g.74841 Transcript_29764/m.74841 type:complete len:260 (+) Transcript_29764:881-1660(+)
MVATHDEEGATIVDTNDGVPNRLTRTCHTHGKWKQTEGGHVGWVVVQHRLVGTDAGEGIDITGLGHANHRMDEHGGLARGSSANGQLTVTAVHRVAGLKTNHTGVGHLDEEGAQLCRGATDVHVVVVHRQLGTPDGTTKIPVTGRTKEIVDTRVSAVVLAKHLDSLDLLIRLVLALDVQYSQQVAFSIAQRDVVTDLEFGSLGLRDIKSDRHRPNRTIGKTAILNHTLVVFLVQEASEGGETTIEQHLEITLLTICHHH